MRNYLTLHLYTEKRLYCCCSTWFVDLPIDRNKQGRIQDFKLGGEGGTLKKNCAERREVQTFLDISCEKSRFYAKKSYFFPILGGARAGCAPPPPGSAPDKWLWRLIMRGIKIALIISSSWQQWSYNTWLFDI